MIEHGAPESPFKDMLLPAVKLAKVPPGLWSALKPEEHEARYDRHAAGYDILIGNALYHRPAWGAWPTCHADFAELVLRQAPLGPILDCGCGSLLFTAKTYRRLETNRITFLDRSLAMLRRGWKRLPEGHFIQANALALPFRDETFALTVCWGTLHVLGTPSGLIGELRRVTMPGGMVALSTLVRGNRRLGERMLDLLHGKGELAAPETEQAVVEEFGRHFAIEARSRIGNFLFLTGRTDKPATI